MSISYLFSPDELPRTDAHPVAQKGVQLEWRSFRFSFSAADNNNRARKNREIEFEGTSQFERSDRQPPPFSGVLNCVGNIRQIRLQFCCLLISFHRQHVSKSFLAKPDLVSRKISIQSKRPPSAAQCQMCSGRQTTHSMRHAAAAQTYPATLYLNGRSSNYYVSGRAADVGSIKWAAHFVSRPLLLDKHSPLFAG